MHEALTAALAARVDAEVPLSVMRELGSQEYQAKLLEAQARVRSVMSPTKQCLSRSMLLAGMRDPFGRPGVCQHLLQFAKGCRILCWCLLTCMVCFSRDAPARNLQD